MLIDNRSEIDPQARTENAQPSTSVDREQLFGRLAVRNGFVEQATLDRALEHQATHPAASVADILMQSGALSEDSRRAIDLLLAAHVAKHGDHPQHNLTSVSASSTNFASPPHPDDTVPFDPKLRRGHHLQRRFGDYELLEEIAHGGMGVVFKARQVKLNRLVALKMIRSGEFADDEQVQRFYVEAEAAAKLDHPGIVPVYEVGQANGQHFFSMALVTGTSLNDCVRTRGPLPPAEAADLLKSVVEAVAYAHDKGIIHRDIKPQNILLDEAGQPRLTDFGLAKQVKNETELTATGQVMGTPSYMPPEQAGGQLTEVGPASDVYSLGATLYFVLTGRPPFQTASVVETIQQILKSEPVPLRRLNPALPRDLETVCLKCLQKETTKRYTTAAELADDLGRWLRGEPVVAQPPSLRYVAEKFIRRHRVPLSLAIAVAVILLGTAITAFVGIDLERREALEANRKLDEQSKSLQATNDELTEQLYDNNIAVAERELTPEQDIDLANELLSACPERLRGWEWHYLMRLRDGPRTPLAGHQGGVWMADFSPDGAQIATGSIDGTLKLWDTQSGRLLSSIDADPDPVLPFPLPGVSLSGLLTSMGISRRPITCVAYSPTGDRIATGSFAPKVSLEGGFVPQINLHDSPGVITLWDAQTGTEKLKFHEQIGVVLSLAFHPKGRQIASSSINPDNTFVVWDSQSAQVIKVVRGHSSHVHRLRYSPDGRRLAAADTSGTVKFYDAETLELIEEFVAHPAPVIDVAFSRDGSKFATAGQDGTIRIWRADSLEKLHELKGHTGSALGVSFSPDGQRLASAGFDKTVRLWDTTTGREKITLRGHQDTVWSVAFNHDGRQLASASFDKTVRIWDATPREEYRGPGEPLASAGHTDRANCVAYSADGRYLASGSWDKQIRLWDAKSGALHRTLSGHTGAIWGLALSPDGERLASASWDHSVKIWNTATGRELLSFAGHTAPVHSVAFSSDGQKIVSGGWDGNVKIWDAATGTISAHCDGFVFPIMAVAFSPDDRFVASGGADRSVKIWDAQTGQTKLAVKEHLGAVHGVAFSPDGKRLASASWDHTIKIWDVEFDGSKPVATRVVRTLVGHQDRVLGVSYSPDGVSLVSVGEDKTMRFWNAESGEESSPTRRHRGCLWSVAFSPDGERLAVACWSKSGWIKTHSAP